MKLEFNRLFSKDLDRLTSEELKSQVADLVEAIEQANSLSQIPQLKKMKGHKKAYRIRLGDYRLGLLVRDAGVELMRLAHRRDIYRLFP